MNIIHNINKKLVGIVLVSYILLVGTYIGYKINKIYTTTYYPISILTIVGYNTTEYIIKPNSSEAILEKLSMCCNITDIGFINEKKLLKYLDLSGNKNIENLNKLHLPYLETLKLSDCNITDIYFLNNFNKLLILDISHNPYIKNINELYIPSLTVLNLKHNNITNTNFINKFTNLTSLII